MKKEIYIDSDGQELTKKISSDYTWYENKHGNLHRLDGPVWISSNGYKAWYKNGNLHRLDGPAKIYPDGTEEYYLDGKPVSKKEIDLIWLRKRVGK